MSKLTKQMESISQNEGGINLEQTKEIFLEHLRDEIWQTAQAMDAKLSEDELRVAWQSSKTEEEKKKAA